jgi:hypothetical protein
VQFDGYRVDDQTTFALDYLKTPAGKSLPVVYLLSGAAFSERYGALCRAGWLRRALPDAAVPADLANRPGDWPQNLPDYYGMCKNLDENLGRIVDYLKASGEYDNTIILFFSDHGCHFRTRNDEYKRSCHESSIRIPCVARGGTI